MKVIYCSRREDYFDLKLATFNNMDSKIKTKYKTKYKERRDFDILQNIEYEDITEYTDYEVFYGNLMSKISFGSDSLSDSKSMFDQYIEINKKFAEKINYEESDLIIINDPQLLLLPLYVSCKVAIMNVKFDRYFARYIPYIETIIKSFTKDNTYIFTIDSISFMNLNLYLSIEYSNIDITRIHYIDSYIDKKSVYEILEIVENNEELMEVEDPKKKIKEEIIKAELLDYESGCRKANKIRQYSDVNLKHNKNQSVICDSEMLLLMEPFINSNPNTKIYVARLELDFSIYTDRMIQFLKRTYNIDIEVCYSKYELIIAMIRSFCYVGERHVNFANLLNCRIVHKENNGYTIAKNILDFKELPPESKRVFDVEEFLKIFMDFCKIEVGFSGMSFEKENELRKMIIRLILKHRHIPKIFKIREEDSEVEIKENKKFHGDYQNTEILTNNFRKDLNVMMKDATIWKGNPVNIRNYYKELMKDINNRNFLVNTVDDIIENEKFEEPLVLSNTLDYPDPVISESVPKINEEVFKELNIKNQGDCLFDYDGTLVEIKPKPEDAKPTKELIEFFLKHKDRIVLCTGRAQEIIDSWFPKGIRVYAEHGAMFRNSEGEWEFLNGATKGVIQEVKDLICYYSLRLKDSIVEKKTCGYAFHFKLCKQPNAELIVKKLIRDLSNLRLVYKGFSVIRGKGVIEIKQGCKGAVAKNCNPWMVAGDDVTDEYMFANAPNALKVKVGQGPTSADYFVDSVQDFLNFVSFVLSE